MLLKGKTALITGGGTGIGRAAAIRLAEEGAEVWIAGPELSELKETCAQIGAAARPLSCDITDLVSLEHAIETPPHLDIVVGNAGVSFSTPLSRQAGADWRRMAEVNQWGTANTCLLAGNRMIREGTSGRVVIVSSVLAGLAEAGSSAYGMAKAALNQLTRQLAVEWAIHGIAVNAVAPGTVQTSMSFVSGEDEYASEWFRKFYVNPERPRIPLRRPGQPEEIAEGILFLCNPRNSYCTGQILTIDGGLTITF
ncbi:SDR family oxidoreductase [soil metagenome]